MRTLGWSIALALMLACARPGEALAQAGAAQAGDELPAVPPPPPSYPQATEPSAPTQPAPATDASGACVPTCRSGYTCIAGQCISACNPPCAAGEQCTASGECVRPEPALYDEPSTEWSVPAANRGAERHDGFMLRMVMAFGASNMSESFETPSLGDNSFEYSGFSLGLSLDLGASPIDDLVIHARFADLVNPSPSISMNGDDLGEAEDLSVIASMFGVGVTYYFMPINFYLTGAIGPSWISISDRTTDERQSSDLGFGLNVDIGKEWWVSDNWGLGAAGRFWLTTLEHQSDSSVPIDYTLLGFGVAFSATYQ
jgi:hypothetical protein